AYTDLTGWVDLEGPGFSRRCYGFWDGGDALVVRVTATAPGSWHWRGGSDPEDQGLSGQGGSFEAVEWSEEEKTANSCRRGFLRATENGHAFQYADGSPCFLLGDTWWAAGTFRFPWSDGDTPDTPRTFPHYVARRASQGYNCIFIIAALPSWADDGLPASLDSDDGTVLRRAWPETDTGHAKTMQDEAGDTPFEFPGRVPGYEGSVPDLDRINPRFFRGLDRKIDYLNAHGMMPFVEATRRDIGQVWKGYHDWPGSYARYIQYVWSRYQANNCLLSPIHYDSGAASVPAPDWNEAANAVVDAFGTPPFGTPIGVNSHGSSLMNFGHTNEARWLSFHQTGNARRDHYSYSLLTEAYNSNPPVPVLNGEPHYEGMRHRETSGWYHGDLDLACSPSDEGARYVRSAAYGSVLSGGLAGHVYGAGGWEGGLWRADVEEASPVHIWEAMEWPGGGQMRHVRSFLMSEGDRYRELVPSPQLLSPNRDGPVVGFDGWAYCAALLGRGLLLAYLERGTPVTKAVQLPLGTAYEGMWFDPRIGEWSDPWRVRTQSDGELPLPGKPTDGDWALKLKVLAGGGV
ncbi:DUF4038 domain-containing protein, partial [Candidatus Latescibacterota bacterium]